MMNVQQPLGMIQDRFTELGHNDRAWYMNDERLRIQVNNYDTYQTTPSRLDSLYGRIDQVPIIRIYGALVINKQSYNVLVHVHNYYPYVYINHDDEDLGDTLLNDLIEYLEYKLCESFRQMKGEEGEGEIGDSDNLDRRSNNDGNQNRRYIAQISICKGTAVYGYRVGYNLFYKISLLSPIYKTRLVKLINERAITLNDIRKKKGMALKSAKMELYEAHIPYLLQFSTDFNIFGCGWMEIDKCYFRTPVVSSHQYSDIVSLKRGLKPFITSRNILSDYNYKRMGKMLLEVDITTTHILNRENLEHRILHNDFAELRDHEAAVANDTVYLPSLAHLRHDMEYQCEIRQSLNLVHSQGLAKGGSGSESTVWSNNDELREMLNYAISLNSPTGLNYQQYSTERIQKEFDYPTSFELVDAERKFNESKSLQFRDDLKGWDRYNTLFDTDGNARFTQSQSLHSSWDQCIVSQNVSSNSRKTLVESSDYVQQPNMDDDLMASDKDAEEGDKESEQEKEVPETQSIQNDQDILFEITQSRSRNNPYSSDLAISSSSSTKSVESVAAKIKGYVSGNAYCFSNVPPCLSKGNIGSSFDTAGLLRMEYDDPFYRESMDISKRTFILANKKITVPCKNNMSLEAFSMSTNIRNNLKTGKIEDKKVRSWAFIKEPPSKMEMKDWLQKMRLKENNKRRKLRSQIEGDFLHSPDYKFSYNSEKVKRRPDSFSNLTNMTIELFINTFSNLLPNPNNDPLTSIFYNFDDANEAFTHLKYKKGILFYNDSGVHPDKIRRLSLNTGLPIEIFNSEIEMVERLIMLVEIFDPDILSGYEVNANSWGFIIERFRNVFDINLLPQLGRCLYKGSGKSTDRWGYTHTSNIKINGRFLLNIWRLVRSDLSLSNYSLENVAYHLLHQTVPKYSNHDLTEWFIGDNFAKSLFVIKYHITKLDLIIKIVDVQEFITKNIENSRLIGIDFESNFYRGSQFKVESILSRIAKSESLILNSPSKEQVHKLKPIEYIPLILEPESNFYKSPLFVLDFQSLYPSIVIAYNYCYSTFLGKLDNFKQTKNRVGYLNLSLPNGLIDLLSKMDGINISPNGCLFVKRHVRQSLLAKMLSEILDTRIKIKNVMRAFQDDSELTKLYNSRQAALKLIASVTYGYTSATFSGRMPNSEISDAIVATGREILMQSIDFINESDFGARVVYGDTDSLFVYFPGRSKSDAFEVGQKIAKTLTNKFPDPIKLKFEKVYHPCVLLTKKRYVGYSYEYPDQVQPKFDAKGIETIRRDGIPAQQKLVEKTLRILFESQNLSDVKSYTLNEFKKLMKNQVSVGDFCFAKEVRLGSYKSDIYVPPGALVANRLMSNDPMKEPQYRERVPYVVIKDPSKKRLKDRCVSPEEFVGSYKTPSPMSLDHEYYITKVLIPPLARIFNLIGVDVKSWNQELPIYANTFHSDFASSLNKLVKSNSCVSCGNVLVDMNENKLCSKCNNNSKHVVSRFKQEMRSLELKELEFASLCNLCKDRQNLKTGASGLQKETTIQCINNSCNIYYNKFRTNNQFRRFLELEHEVMENLDW